MTAGLLVLLPLTIQLIQNGHANEHMDRGLMGRDVTWLLCLRGNRGNGSLGTLQEQAWLPLYRALVAWGVCRPACRA